jgi:bifunctional DNase/RNase
LPPFARAYLAGLPAAAARCSFEGPLSSRGSGDREANHVQELTVVGVRVELPTNQPIVLLKESDGDRYLPIWIGAVEATAIAFALQNVVTARPMTHDLLKDILDAVGTAVSAVHITDLQDGIFYANLVLDSGVEVSARPSDSIALALRTGATIYAEESVLSEAGIPIADEQENTVAEFREFLDQISPEDFNTSS